MQLPPELERQLADLDGRLPGLVVANLDPGGLPDGVRRRGRCIEDWAGEYASLIFDPIAAMLVTHGRYLVGVLAEA